MCNAEVSENHIDATSRLSLPLDEGLFSDTWLASLEAKILSFPMPWISLVVVMLAILEQQLDHPQQTETSPREVQHTLRYPRGAAEFYSQLVGESVLFCVKNRSKI